MPEQKECKFVEFCKELNPPCQMISAIDNTIDGNLNREQKVDYLESTINNRSYAKYCPYFPRQVLRAERYLEKLKTSDVFLQFKITQGEG